MKAIGFIKRKKDVEMVIVKWALDNHYKIYKDENNELFVEMQDQWYIVSHFFVDDVKMLFCVFQISNK